MHIGASVKGTLHLRQWRSGEHTYIPLEIIGETPKKYRVIFLVDCYLPRYRKKHAGDIGLVPKTAVRVKKTKGTKHEEI